MHAIVVYSCINFDYYVSAFVFCVCALIFIYLLYNSGIKNAIIPLIIFLIAAILAWSGCFTAEKNEKSASNIPTDKKIHMKGTIISKDIMESSFEEGKNYAKLILENNDKGGNIQVNLYSKDISKLNIGDYIEVYGNFETPKTSRNPRSFNYKKHLNSRGIFLLGNCESFRIIGASQGIRFFIYQYIDHVRDVIFSDAPGSRGEVNGLLRGVVLGDKTGIGEEVYDNFRMFGTAHVLAVSGLHVGILLTLYRRIYRSRPSVLLTFMIIIVLIFYGTLTRWSPSVLRAVLMSLIYIFSQIISRDADLLTSLGITSMISLSLNPLVISSLGFQMSYLAILGIGFISPTLTERIEIMISSKFGDVLNSQNINNLSKGMAIYISVQIVVMPYILQEFNYISPLGFLLNLPVTVLAGLIVTLSIASIFLIILVDAFDFIVRFKACCFVENYLISKICLSLFSILQKIRCLIDMVIWGLGKMMMDIHSFSAEHIKTSFDFISPGKAITYTFIVAILLFFSETFYIALKRKKLRRIAVYFVVLIFIFATVSVLDKTPFDKANIVMVDVGQGDCVHVRSNGGINMMFDGGGSRNKNIGKLILKPYLLQNRVAALDLAAITHEDNDHSKGIKELDNIYRIKSLVEGAYAGELAVGSEIRVRVLWPFEDDDVKSGTDNEGSSVFRVDVDGISILVTGDIGVETEKKIIEKYKGRDILNVDVLKVGHHGSKYSTSDEFLKAVNPKVALIGVGKNKYGHPSPSVIDKLRKNDIILYRTDVSGAIGLWKEGNRIRICTMLRE